MNVNPEKATLPGSIAVFGATSGIARAVSAELARRGHGLLLVGRDEAALRAVAADLAVRFGREFPVLAWDLLHPGDGDHAGRFAELIALAGSDGLSGVFFSAGIMPPEEKAHADAVAARLLFNVNLTEPIVVLNLFADYFKERKGGFLAAVSSVAGDRGRPANKTYGAAKAGLTAYLEGLRHSLHPRGVRVCTLKPGPVRTPMTAGYQGLSLLLSDPEPVARALVDGIGRGKRVVYAPGYWRWVMAILRRLPDSLWRKVPG